MSTQQELNTSQIDEHEVEKSYDAYEFFVSIFQEIPKKYKLSQTEIITLQSSYFYKLYELRKANNALEATDIVLNYETIKGLSLRVIKTYNRNTLSEKLSHEWFMTKFREKLQIKKGEDTSNKLFQLSHLDICIYDIKIEKDTTEYQAIEYTKFILEEFNAPYEIPLELYIVVLYDVSLTLLENAERFQSFSSEIRMIETYKILTHQISTIGKRISEYSDILFLPPMKHNLSFNMHAQTEDDTCSLQLLTDYFGDACWHKQFQQYDENNSHEYFCYNEEPEIKVRLNKRQYKKKSIKAKSTSEFLSDENRKDFFKQWESRLYKNEKIFFQEYVKPKILQGVTSIKVDNNKENEILVNGIFDTANFEYHHDNLLGSCTVIDSTSISEDYIEINIVQDLVGA